MTPHAAVQSSPFILSHCCKVKNNNENSITALQAHEAHVFFFVCIIGGGCTQSSHMAGLTAAIGTVTMYTFERLIMCELACDSLAVPAPHTCSICGIQSHHNMQRFEHHGGVRWTHVLLLIIYNDTCMHVNVGLYLCAYSVQVL